MPTETTLQLRPVSATFVTSMLIPSRYVLPVFLIVIFAGAMVLGPLLYFALQPIFPVPFHRAMARAILISALAALGLFWIRLPLRELWPWNGDAWKRLLLGFFIAMVSLQAMFGAYLALAGFSSSHLSGEKVAGRFILALVAAIIIPPLEETIFRGFLQRELVGGMGRRAGWFLASIVFALAHFLKVPAELDARPVHWWSGPGAVGAAFAHLGNNLAAPDNSVKAMNLLLVGLILGGVYLRSGSLWMNAGLHGGWIFGLLLFTGLTVQDKTPRYAWAGGDILSSVVTSVVLLLVGLWLWRFYRHPSASPESGLNAP